jgi:glycosyltransferase involved in cell wall biosynthesis
MQSGGLRTRSIIKQSQENMPLATVITVVRNGEETLEETILSVINQAYENIEYVIVDGASTDNTIDIIRKYEDKIDYWMSESDGGIYYAMNKGIDLATGEWINFMNSGDTFHSVTVVAEFCKYINFDIDIFYGGVCFNKNKKDMNNKKINDLYFLMGHMICHQAIFARRKLFFLKKFDISFTICADKEWLIYLYKHGVKLQLIPIVVCNFADPGISSNISEMQKEIFFITKWYYGNFGLIFVKFKYLCSRLVKKLFVPGRR